jgi:hypothetical protein
MEGVNLIEIHCKQGCGETRTPSTHSRGRGVHVGPLLRTPARSPSGLSTSEVSGHQLPRAWPSAHGGPAACSRLRRATAVPGRVPGKDDPKRRSILMPQSRCSLWPDLEDFLLVPSAPRLSGPTQGCARDSRKGPRGAHRGPELEAARLVAAPWGGAGRALALGERGLPGSCASRAGAAIRGAVRHGTAEESRHQQLRGKTLSPPPVFLRRPQHHSSLWTPGKLRQVGVSEDDMVLGIELCTEL